MKRPKGFRYAPNEEPLAGLSPTLADEPIPDEPDANKADAPETIPVESVAAVSVPAELEGASLGADLSPDEHVEPIGGDATGTQAEDHETWVIDPLPDESDAEPSEILPEQESWISRLRKRSEADEEYRAAKRAVKHAERQRKRRERRERGRFTQEQRAARNRLFIALGAITVLVLSVGIGAFTPLMSVKNVDVRGTDRVPVATITDALEPLQNRPLALVTDDEVHQYLAPLTLLESFAVEKIPPSTLRIVVHEREPVVAVPHGDSLLLIDPAGVRIDQVPREERPAGIPIAQGIGSEYSTDEFRAMAAVLRGMPDDLRVRIAEVSAETPQQVKLTLDDGLPVMWGDATQNSRKAVVLDSMLQALAEVALKSVDVSSPEAPVYVPA